MSQYIPEPDRTVHVHHFFHFFQRIGGMFGGRGTVPPADAGDGSSSASSTRVTSTTTSRDHGLRIRTPWELLAFLALLVLIALGLIKLGEWLFSDHGGSQVSMTRVITPRDFVKARHINVSKAVPLRMFEHSSDGVTELQILRKGHIVYVNLPRSVQVIQKHSFRFQQLTATFTYNYRPLYRVPATQVPVGKYYSPVHFNDPNDPHTGGKRIDELIASYNEMPLKRLVVMNLRTVTIRGI